MNNIWTPFTTQVIYLFIKKNKSHLTFSEGCRIIYPKAKCTSAFRCFRCFMWCDISLSSILTFQEQRAQYSHSTVARSRLFSGLFFKIIKSRNSYIHVLFAQLARKLRVTLNNKIAFAANTAIKDGHLAFYPQQWGFWGISSFHAGTELF